MAKNKNVKTKQLEDATLTKVKGSFEIKNPTGTERWYVRLQQFKNGRKSHKHLPKKSYQLFGFNSSMTPEEAKVTASLLNARKSELRALEKAQAAINAKAIETLDEGYFPSNLVNLFNAKVADSGQRSAAHVKKLMSHFKFIQKMCLSLKIMPAQYNPKAALIYKYLISKRVSSSYSQRLISILNNWGSFYCKHSQEYFEPVEQPRGDNKKAIIKAQKEKTGVKRASKDLTKEHLQAISKLRDDGKISLAHYNYIHLSFYLGLRPHEVRCLLIQEYYKIDEASETPIISVFMTKICDDVEDERGWKHIPLFLPEQVACIDIINSGVIKQPTYKMAKEKIFPAGVTFYGGRKAFTNYMLREMGQDFVNIAQWLGHKSINRTYQAYLNKTKTGFTPLPPPPKLKIVK